MDPSPVLVQPSQLAVVCSPKGAFSIHGFFQKREEALAYHSAITKVSYLSEKILPAVYIFTKGEGFQLSLAINDSYNNETNVYQALVQIMTKFAISESSLDPKTLEKFREKKFAHTEAK